jgi:hypothetical protein
MATQRTPARPKAQSKSKPKPRAKGLRRPISAEVRALPATQGMLAEVRNELLERQDRADRRMDALEDMVRSLASGARR